MRSLPFAFVSSLLLTSPVIADVTLPAFFSSGVVLQRDCDVPMWGTATPGAILTIALDDQKQIARVGEWTIRFNRLVETIALQAQAFAVVVERGDFVRQQSAPGTPYYRANRLGVEYCKNLNLQPSFHGEGAIHRTGQYSQHWHEKAAPLQLAEERTHKRLWQEESATVPGQKTRLPEIQAELTLIGMAIDDEDVAPRRPPELPEWLKQGHEINVEGSRLRVDEFHLLAEAIRCRNARAEQNSIVSEAFGRRDDLVIAVRTLLRELEQRVTAEQSIVNSPDTAKNGESLTKEEQALGLLVGHPEWTPKQIADAVDVSRTTVYRWPRFAAARKALRQTAEIPRGKKDGKTGVVEAWHDDES